MHHPQSLVVDHVSWFSNSTQQLQSAKGSKDNPCILPQLAVLTLVVQLSPVLGEPFHLHLLTKQRQKVFKRYAALLWRERYSAHTVNEGEGKGGGDERGGYREGEDVESGGVRGGERGRYREEEDVESGGRRERGCYKSPQ